MAITKEPIPKIFEEDFNSEIQSKISYWKKQMEGYFCHLFIVEIEDELTLSKFWEFISTRVGINFQTELNEDIEEWNIYLIFLVRHKIRKEVKYKIEQDKFYCRKLVEDELSNFEFTPVNIIKLIEENIFSMTSLISEVRNPNLFIDQSVITIIKNYNKDIIEILKDYKASNTNFSAYYEKFKALQNG